MERCTIGQAAKRAGINLETIRYYEREGVLPKPPRTESGYRMLSDHAIQRLRFVRQAQELGFSLKEIEELLALQVKPGVSCADIRAKAKAKIADVDEKIRNLEAIRNALLEMAATCSGRGPVSGCSILQLLNDGETQWRRT
jgi:MerR family mercuric resistance operon transcriptional regulator